MTDAEQTQSNTFIRALKTGHGPDTFAWNNANGFRGGSHPQVSHADRPSTTRPQLEREALELRLESMRVSRDPCFLCGTRADVGCKHKVAA